MKVEEILSMSFLRDIRNISTLREAAANKGFTVATLGVDEVAIVKEGLTFILTQSPFPWDLSVIELDGRVVVINEAGEVEVMELYQAMGTIFK